MTVARLLALVLVCVLGTAPSASAQIDVSVSSNAVSTRLGDSFSFRTKITNNGPRPMSGLVAHMDVVGLSSGIYVDPEDWSSERTKSVAALGPGESTDLSWQVTAVTGGHASVYVVVLAGEDATGAARRIAVSPAVDVRIADTKDLNSGGVLPLALGVPALLGLLTLAVRRRRTR